MNHQRNDEYKSLKSRVQQSAQAAIPRPNWNSWNLSHSKAAAGRLGKTNTTMSPCFPLLPTNVSSHKYDKGENYLSGALHIHARRHGLDAPN